MISRLAFEVIFTHDLHSHFDNLPKIASKIKALRQQRVQNKEPYLIVDIGDHLDRAHYITEGSSGLANVALLNELHYDYVTIGNNEGITLDYAQLSQLYQDAHFKVVVNNLFDQDGKRPDWCIPFDVTTLNGIKVGIVGTTVNFTRFYEQLGWKVSDPFQAVADSVALLREQVDFILLLSHLGLPRDQEMAQRVPGIDLILGSHTHHFLPEGLKVGNTWIHQVGKHGQYLGRVQVYRDRNNTFTCTPYVEEVKEEEPDQETLTTLGVWAKKAENHLSQPVAVLDEDLPISWDEETVLGNLLAEAVSDWCNTPIALVNTGLILDSLSQGTITLKDVHHICPHPINACRLTLTGEEILSILNRSLQPSMVQFHIKGLGFRGKRIGMMALNGLKVYYEETKDQTRQVVYVETPEGPLKENGTYRVATVDMFTFGPIFPELYGKKDTEYFLPDFLRDLLIRRFKQGELYKAAQNRWVKRPSFGTKEDNKDEVC